MYAYRDRPERINTRAERYVDMSEGQNVSGRTETVEKYEGGTVHVFDDANELDDDDTQTELDAKSGGSTSTAAGDWSVSHDTAAGTSELSNDAEVRITGLDAGTYTQVAIVNDADADQFTYADIDESETVDEGDELFFESGNLEFTIGGQ